MQRASRCLWSLPDLGESLAKQVARVPGSEFRGSLTVTKDSDMQAFVDRWADDAGYASVLFDYRYFGGSGGTPRDKVSLVDQYEDYRSVLAWVRSQPERFQMDKIVVMGGAASGLSVARLAVEDGKLAGAMAHCPVLDGASLIMGTEVELMVPLSRLRDHHGHEGEPSPALLGFSRLCWICTRIFASLHPCGRQVERICFLEHPGFAQRYVALLDDAKNDAYEDLILQDSPGCTRTILSPTRDAPTGSMPAWPIR
jgi:pimeloyl-ACP methyl ester carboxylesterase